MGLVDYSDSESDEPAPTVNKRKLSTAKTALPPLPPGFRDLYSSTVRTSTHDDPALHHGRKRVTPHVAGNWPTHVYLDWTPPPQDDTSLHALITHARNTSAIDDDDDDEIHSLLENDLGVQQPLHVSLSRPLALKTDNKDQFLQGLKAAVCTSNLTPFNVQPLDLVWHPNEDESRWFLVLRLQRPIGDELRILLKHSNDLASQYEQPLLYGHQNCTTHPATNHDNFHISIAWSTQPRRTSTRSGPIEVDIPAELLGGLQSLETTFYEVKVRLGQDVHAIPLRQTRKR